MGLDMIEFVMAVEDTFALSIPDSDAQNLTTPRKLIDYLLSRLPNANAEEGSCLSQRAFYLLRSATCAELGLSRCDIRPDSSLLTLFPEPTRQKDWLGVKAGIGAIHWPKIGKARMLRDVLSPRITKFSELAGFLIERHPVIVKGGKNLWSRVQVAEVVNRLIVSELGITKYNEDSEFVGDLGVD